MTTNNKNYVLYFFCTPYKKSSAGVRTIYHMIDYYNKNNQPAFTLFQNETIGASGYSIHDGEEDLIAPALTIDLLNEHIAEKKIPIFLYPDTVSGNIFNAENVCRLILYYDSELTGKSSLSKTLKEGIVFFSSLIKEKANINSALFQNIISLPVAQKSLINYKLQLDARHGEAYYDGKFSRNFGGKIPKNISKLEEIDRDKKNSITQENLFNKLKNLKLLHVFEDTALIYESLLLGCPVNIHPNGAFYKKKPLGDKEVTLYGALSKENVCKEDIDDALKVINKFKNEYLKWLNNAYKQMDSLIESFDKFEGDYNDKNIKLIKENIKFSEIYSSRKEKNYSLKRNIIILLLIKILHKIYKILISSRIGRNLFKNILLRIYHGLPTRIKKIITNSLKELN